MTSFILDTFDGTGTLATHVDSFGNAYATGTYSSAAPADYVLDGSGRVTTTIQPPAGSNHLVSTAIPPGPNYWLELEFVDQKGSNFYDDLCYVALMARNTETAIPMLSINGLKTGTFFRPMTLSTTGAGFIQTNYPEGGGSPAFYPEASFEAGSFAVDGTHVLRMEVEGPLLRGFLDGVQYVEGLNTSLSETVGWAGFELQGSATGNVLKVLRFEAGPLGAPEPPGPFWTLLSGTQEILA